MPPRAAIESLPDECLTAVLARAAARPGGPPGWAAIVSVCRRWRRLAKAAITEISLRDRGCQGSGPGEPPVVGTGLAAALPALTRLSLHFDSVPHEDLRHLSAISTLTDLRVELAGQEHNDEIDHVELQRTFRSLTALSTSCERLHYTRHGDIHTIATACRHLTELLLLHSEQDRSGGFTAAGLESIGRNLRQLRRFRVHFCRSFTDSGIRQVALGCTLLQDISMHSCPNVSAHSVHAVLEACPELRRLRFHQRWNDPGLRFSHAVHLTISRLEMVEIVMSDDAGASTNTAMAILALSCTQLRELHVHAVTDPRPDVSRLDLLKNCAVMPALVTLTMTGFQSIEMTSFAAFLVGAPLLENLTLEDCKLLGVVQALPMMVSLRSIECCSSLVGPLFDYWDFGKWCHNLTSLLTLAQSDGENLALSLAGCNKLVTLKIEAYHRLRQRRLPWTCPPLGSLRTLICENVHWQDLAALARASPRLEEVHLQSCTTMNKKAILGLLSSCPRLGYIRILGCSKLSPVVMDRLAYGLNVRRGHVYERVHLELVDGKWGLNGGKGSMMYSTYRVHRSQCNTENPTAIVGHTRRKDWEGGSPPKQKLPLERADDLALPQGRRPVWQPCVGVIIHAWASHYVQHDLASHREGALHQRCQLGLCRYHTACTTASNPYLRNPTVSPGSAARFGALSPSTIARLFPASATLAHEYRPILAGGSPYTFTAPSQVRGGHVNVCGGLLATVPRLPYECTAHHLPVLAYLPPLLPERPHHVLGGEGRLCCADRPRREHSWPHHGSAHGQAAVTKFVANSNGAISTTVTLPPNSNIGPQEYYLLFVIVTPDGVGAAVVPSICKWVQLGGIPAYPPPAPSPYPSPPPSSSR
eukprot:SM000012S25393  [mRNA]  locus=s12:844790:848151:+ [translate_table: standard]